MTLSYTSHSAALCDSITTDRFRAVSPAPSRTAWNDPACASWAASNNGTRRLDAITLISSAPVVPPTAIRAPDAGSGTSVRAFARTRLSDWKRFGKSTVVDPSGPTLSTVT